MTPAFSFLLAGSLLAFAADPAPFSQPTTVTSVSTMALGGSASAIGGGGSFGGCGSAHTFVLGLENKIRPKYNQGDVSIYVDQIEMTLENCHLPPSEFGWQEGTLDNWRNTGWRSELEKTRHDIEQDSKFGNVDASLARFYELGKKLEIPEQKLKSFGEHFRAQANASSIDAAKTCAKTIDHHEALGPVRNQGALGWCYAYAAADLVSYKLSKRISAADAGLTFSKSWWHLGPILDLLGVKPGTLDGGSTGPTLDKLLEQGSCPEDAFRSNDNGYGSLLATLNQLADKGTSAARGRPSTPPDTAQICEAVIAEFPQIPLANLNQILAKAVNQDILTLLQKEACSHRIPLPNLKETTSYSLAGLGSEGLVNQIDEQLAKGNIAAFGYNASILFDRHGRSSVSGGHESVIVGRRFNKNSGTCEYLVRNSWGRGCAGYDPSYDCNEGNIWIPKAALVYGIDEVSYLH